MLAKVFVLLVSLTLIKARSAASALENDAIADYLLDEEREAGEPLNYRGSARLNQGFPIDEEVDNDAGSGWEKLMAIS